MPLKSPSTKVLFVSAIFVPLLGSPLAGGLSARQASSQATAQINRQVVQFAAQPVKVTATTLAPATVGAKSQIQVALLNADNQPVPAKEDSQFEVTIAPPSGASVSQPLVIKAGQSIAQFDFSPAQAGVTSITVRPIGGGVVRPNQTVIVVRPPAKSVKTKKRKNPQGSLVWPGWGTAGERPWAAATTRLGFRTVAVSLDSSASSPGPKGPGTPQPPSPVLHIFVDNIADPHYATGKDAAVISAIYDSPDLSPAPTDIDIYFQLTTGSLDPPPPLKIPKGSFKATTQLTSTSPADVHVTFGNSTPAYSPQGDTDFTIHFVAPLVHVNVPDTLSVVDNPSITVDFRDEHGNQISTGQSYQVSLHSEQSKLRIVPNPFQPPTGHADLFPVSVGSDTIDAAVTNYPTQKLDIVITGWLVLGLCLAGGVAGGLAAYNKFKGSWLWRIFLGILGGAILCWLYIYLALPSVNVNIAHNTFSVFFVALLGGYAGTASLDFAAKKLGLGISEQAQPAEGEK